MSKKTIAGLTVEIGGDTTKLGKALTDVDKQSAALSRELGEINKLLKLDPTNTELLAQKQKVLSEAISSTKERLEILKTAHEQAAEAAKNGNAEAEEKMRALEREIIATEQKLNSYEGAAEETEIAMKDLGDQADDTAKSEKNLGNQSEGAREKLEGQKKSAADARKELGELAEKGADKAAKSIAAVAAAAVATVAALGKLVLEEGEAASQTQDLSAKTGLSVQKLQEYQYVAKMAGTDLSTLSGAQTKLIKNMATASKGTGDAANAFNKLGVSILDNNGELRDHDEVFSEVLAKLRALPNETERDALAMQIFGKSAMELNPLIKAGAENIDAWTKQAHQLGIIVSDETNAALSGMYQEVKTVGSQFDALKQNFASKFAPVATKLLKAVQTAIKKVQDELSKPAMRRAVEKLGKVVTELIEKGVKKGAELLPKLANAAAYLLEHLKGIIVALGSVWGILKTVSVVTNAAKAFNALKTAFDSIKAASSAAGTGLANAGSAASAAGASAAATIGVIGAAVAVSAALVKKAYDDAAARNEELLRESNEVRDAIKETSDALAAAHSSYVDTIGDFDGAAQVADRYIERLEELEGQTSMTTDEQREYNSLVAALSELMPQLNLDIDAQTGLLKNGASELRDQIGLLKERIRLSAMEELLKEQLKAEVEYQNQLTKAKKNYNKYWSEDAKRYRQIYELMSNSGGYGINADDLAFWQSYRAEIGDTSRSLVDFDHAAGDAADALNEAQIAADGCASETDELMTSYTEAAGAAGLLSGANEDMADSADQAADAVGGDQNSLSAALEKARQGAQQLAQSHFEHLDDAAHNIFEAISTESDLSMQEMIDNLKTNIQAAHEWNDNLAKLIEMGAPAELVESLMEMGVAGAGAVKTIVESTPEEIEELFGLYEEAGNVVSTDAEMIGESVGEMFAKGLEDGAADAPNIAERIGDATGQGFENGLNNRKGSIEKAAKRIAFCVRDALQQELDIHSPSGVTEDFGENTDEGLIQGMKKKLGAVFHVSTDVGRAAVDGLQQSLMAPDLPNVTGVMRTVSSPASNANSLLDGKLDKILAAIEKGQILMLDGQALVGATAERMDQALGGIAFAAGRGAT